MGVFDHDNVNPLLGHTVTYAYDSLNRLTNAQASGNVSYDLPFSYTADGSNGRYGNVTCVINGNTSGFCPAYSFNSANNHITNSGYTYDAAGDQLSDSSYTYQYDAEGHITTMLQGGSAYAEFIYNARGQAVETTYPVYSNTEVVGVFGPAGRELGYYDGGSGDWYDRDIRAAGRMVAQSYAADTYFLHANALHSDTQITDYSGAVQTDFVYYPWQMWEHSGVMVDAHFAGFQQSGGQNYPTPTRTYSSPDGRWLTPDPAGRGAVDLSNPQSWNAYAYALNNPTTRTDPSGLNACSANDKSQSDCHVTITIVDRTRDKSGNYNDRFTGVKNQEQYNATATVTVNGKVKGTYLTKTTPSSSKYATIKAGTYRGTLFPHKKRYPAIKLTGEGMPTGRVPALGGLDSFTKEPYIQDAEIHMSGLGNITGFTRSGIAISEGCSVIACSEYPSFESTTGLTARIPQKDFLILVGASANGGSR